MRIYKMLVRAGETMSGTLIGYMRIALQKRMMNLTELTVAEVLNVKSRSVSRMTDFGFRSRALDICDE